MTTSDSRRMKVLVLAFVVLAALISPPLSQATIIEVNLTFDLDNSHFGTGRDYPVYWDPGQYFYFPEVHPVVGDSLRFSMDFVDLESGQAQRLKISELGIWEAIEGAWGTAQGDISVNAIGTNYFSFHDVAGDIFSNPVSNVSNSGGAGVGTTLYRNMTDTSFSFTGITWQIDFSELTYHSGNAFNVMALGLQGDRIEVVHSVPEPPAPVPEPSTLLVVASGFATWGAMAWRRHRRG